MVVLLTSMGNAHHGVQTLPACVGRVFLMADDDNVIYWPSYAVALGQRVRTLRAMRDISQERLAELAGVHRNAVVGLERGVSSRNSSANPQLATVYRIARALHVPLAVLLPDATTPPRRLCRATEALPSEVDVVWPREPEDVLPFDGSHVIIDGDDPRFVDEFHPLYVLRQQARLKIKAREDAADVAEAMDAADAADAAELEASE